MVCKIVKAENAAVSVRKVHHGTESHNWCNNPDHVAAYDLMKLVYNVERNAESLVVE